MRHARYLGIAVALLGFCWGGACAEVVVVVSAKSAVSALSKNQMTDIFLGKANRFPNGEQAVPIDQPEGSLVHDEFYATFAGKSAAQLKTHWSKIIFTGRGQPPAEVTNSSEVKKRVAGNPAAIGYLYKSDLDNSVKALTISP